VLGEDAPLRVRVGGADPGLLGGSLALKDLALVPADSVDGGGSFPTATVARIDLSGIDRWTLLAEGGLRLDRLTLTAPRVRLPSGGGTAQNDTAAGDGSSAPPRPLADRLEDLPPLGAGAIVVTDGGLGWGQAPELQLTGIAIRLRDVEVSAAAARDSGRVLFSRGVSLELPVCRWRTTTADHVLGPLRISTDDSSLDLARFAVLPRDSTGAVIAPMGLESSGIQMDLGPLTARGLHLGGGALRPDIRVRRLDAARLALHVFSEAGNPPATPPSMPHEMLRDLPALVRIDSLRLDSGDIRYTEKPASGGAPGTILFASIQADLSGLSNDPARAGAPPTEVRVRTDVADRAPLRVLLRQDLLSGHLDAEVSGELADLPADGFNSFLVPHQGIRFTGGRLDSLAFSYTLSDRRAHGRAHGRFADVAIEVVGDDRESGLSEDLKGLIGNAFVLRSGSAEEAGADSLLSVSVRYNRTPHDTYLAFLWKGLRSGLKNLVGI